MAGTVTWRPSDDMAAWLRERAELAHADAGLSSRTRIELTMWRKALAVELGRTRWSLSELGLIADVCNEPGTRERLHSPTGRIAEAVAIATASAPGLYGQKWGTNEVFLIGKLTQLGPIAASALVDAVARWWRDEAEHTVEGWASVGVTAVEGTAILGDGSLLGKSMTPEAWQDLQRTMASGIPFQVLTQPAEDLAQHQDLTE